MRLLLDTHTFIWWDDGKLPPVVVERIQTAKEVWLSAASAWEMVIKAGLGRLTLRTSVRAIAEDNGFALLPITVEHADAVRALKRHHRDPFDRMLVAQARVEGLVIVTADPMLARYGAPVVWD